jgi:uncharacterized protein YecE (DUF72 family)
MENQGGCILFQAPPSFKNNAENEEILKNFLKNLNPDFNNVIEFRHSSWWNVETLNLLKNYNVAFCTVSGIHMPSDLMISADFAYLRFHGPEEVYSSEYSDDQLKSWADSVKELLASNKVNDVYCYFNNDFYGFAVKNAKTLQSLLGKQF